MWRNSTAGSTLIIDRGGNIQAKHEGLVSKSVYEKEIANLLEGAR
jgi:hypothetical protein